MEKIIESASAMKVIEISAFLIISLFIKYCRSVDCVFAPVSAEV